MEQKDFALVLINNVLKNRRKTKSFLAKLNQDTQQRFTVYYSEYPGHIIELSKLFGAKYHYLLSFGGDGTHHEVVQGLMEIQQEFRPKLMLFPGGSGNDFLSQFSSPRIDTLLAFPENMNLMTVDVGCVQTEKSRIYFLNICSLGFTGKVVERLNNFRKKTGIRKSYLIAIFQALFTYKNIKLKVLPFSSREKEYFLITICNGSTFGNGLKIAPSARVNDQKLELVSMEQISIKDVLLNLKKIKKGEKLVHKEVSYYNNIENTEIISQKTVSGEADGEPFEAKNFKFFIVPSALDLVF